MSSHKQTLIVIGGGAAGFFGAIAWKEANLSREVILLEKARQVLSKVRISGGGRCNVTHACFDPAELIKFYPRGGKELRGPFSRFQPKDTIEWFLKRGVKLKVEDDGRMFPVTDNSETIIDCLMNAVKQTGVDLRVECGVDAIEKEGSRFIVHLTSGKSLIADAILLATGSSARGLDLAKNLGHTLIPPVPSLFTFNVPDSPLHELAGVSVEFATLTLSDPAMDQSYEESGPLLITHWGFSGPAVLKLSAWAARSLHSVSYDSSLKINWLPLESQDSLKCSIIKYKQEHPARLVLNDCPFLLPKSLWKVLVSLGGIAEKTRWSALSNKQLIDLLTVLTANVYKIKGKTTYKSEFVTAGGVKLSEVNFKTMESRLCPGLFFAGEILDIDGVTGGFNFQNAWTTAWISSQC